MKMKVVFPLVFDLPAAQKTTGQRWQTQTNAARCCDGEPASAGLAQGIAQRLETVGRHEASSRGVSKMR